MTLADWELRWTLLRQLKRLIRKMFSYRWF